MNRNPEQPPDAEEDALGATIRQLAERRDAAREGSAEVIRQLKGLRNSKLAEEIMEAYGYWGGD